MRSPVEPFLRRDRGEKFPPWQAYVLMGLVVLFSLALFADKVLLVGGIFSEKAHAQETPPTQKEMCQSIKGGEEVHGVSARKLKAYCSRYGVSL